MANFQTSAFPVFRLNPIDRPPFSITVRDPPANYGTSNEQSCETNALKPQRCLRHGDIKKIYIRAARESQRDRIALCIESFKICFSKRYFSLG